MAEMAYEGQGEYRERLEELTGILGVSTVVQAWGVSEEEIEGYISGALPFPDNDENERRLGLGLG